MVKISWFKVFAYIKVRAILNRAMANWDIESMHLVEQLLGKESFRLVNVIMVKSKRF